MPKFYVSCGQRRLVIDSEDRHDAALSLACRIAEDGDYVDTSPNIFVTEGSHYAEFGRDRYHDPIADEVTVYSLRYCLLILGILK